MRWTMAAVWIASVAVGCGGEGAGRDVPGCPDVGCAEQLRVHFDGQPLDAPGVWSIVAETDGPITCTVTLPAIDGQLDGQCDGAYARLFYDTDPEGPHRIDGFILDWDAPEQLVLTIALDDEVQFVVDLSPDYQDHPLPGGEECGSCKGADETVVLEPTSSR